jgi:hypothetical protein
VLLAGFVIGVAAGIGAVWRATNPPAASSVASGPGSSAGPSVRLVIKTVSTPDGEEPAFVGPNGLGAAVLFSAVAGQKTEVTIVNDSQEAHIFDLSSLGVNTLQISPGPSTVHFSIDPTSKGVASWQCIFPCGNWVMSQSGYMFGSVKVT